MSDRDDTIRGLRALADFLEAHPEVPVCDVDASPSLFGTDDEDRAEVDRIAAILGLAPEQTAGSHYRVKRDFGGRVIYRATAITEAHMTAYSEHMARFRDSRADSSEASVRCDHGSDRESGWCEEPAAFTVRGDGTEGTPCAAHLAWAITRLTDDGRAPSVEAIAPQLEGMAADA